MLLTSGPCGQALPLLDIRTVCVSASGVPFKIGDLLTTSGPGDPFSEVHFDAYAPDGRLCVYTAITDYLASTKSSRGLIRIFIISNHL